MTCRTLAAVTSPRSLATADLGAAPISSAPVDDLTRLLVAARDGDMDALTAAIRSSQDEVWRLAASLVGSTDADDVTQDTFVRAWNALPAFRADASGRTWLLAIARRAGVDALRTRGRRRRLTDRLAALPRHVEPVASTAPSTQELVAALEPSRRIAFVLTQVLGYTYADAAEVCGVPVGTIRSRVARARQDLVGDLRAAETA